MRHRHSGLHSIHLGVEGAQTHRALEVLCGAVRLPVPDSQESAQEPGRREIWVEPERPVDQGNATVEVACEVAERMGASRKRDGVVFAQLDGPTGNRAPSATS